MCLCVCVCVCVCVRDNFELLDYFLCFIQQALFVIFMLFCIFFSAVGL